MTEQIKEDQHKYTYSYDGETYEGEFETREEALAEAKEDNIGRRVPATMCYIAELDWKPFSFFFDLDHWQEQMSENANDFASESADNWPDLSEKHQAELSDLIDEWATRTGNQPYFWGIIEKSISEHKLN